MVAKMHRRISYIRTQADIGSDRIAMYWERSSVGRRAVCMSLGLLVFLFLHFFVELLKFLFNFGCIFGVRI